MGRVNEFNSTWHDGTKVEFGLVRGRSFQGGPFEAPWSPGKFYRNKIDLAANQSYFRPTRL